jgi:phage/plasmid-associated DNA primase
VIDTTRAYREEMDPIPQFIEDNFAREATGRVINKVMWSTYQAWATKNADFKKLGRKQFSKALFDSGIDQEMSGGRYWLGLGLIQWQASADEGGS